MPRLARCLLICGTVLSLAAVLLISSGRLNGMSNDGSVDTYTAYQAISLYWLLGVAFCRALAKIREFWKQYVLLGFSLFGCLVAIEIGLRIIKPELALREFEFVRSNTQHHVLLPDSSYHLGQFEGREVIVETNQDRLRTSYSVNAFRKKAVRVICLGDSFTFGAWLPASSSYPEQLEALYRESGRSDIGVLNAGMLSYSPLLHEQLMKLTLLKYKPDVVTLMLDCTDIGDDYHYGLGFDETSSGPRFSGPEVSKPNPHLGALWRIAKPVHPSLLAPFKLLDRLSSNYAPHDPLDYYQFEIPVDGNIEDDRFFIYRHPLSETREFFDATLASIERIASLCKQNEIEFILFVAPRYHHWSTVESSSNWEAGTYGDYESYQNEIFNYFDAKTDLVGFPIVNMLGDFKQTNEFPLVFETDPHWNQAGNRFVARILKRELDKLKLINRLDTR